MTYEEFVYWQAFNVLEPIGIYREDLLFGNIAKTLFDVNISDHALGLENFMMFRQPVERTVEDVCDDIKARMATLV
jgi:hypothetical protein